MLSIFMKKLTVNQARNKVTTSKNALLIDCRPKEEYAHGHVSGAISIPIEKITEERVCRRIPDKTTDLPRSDLVTFLGFITFPSNTPLV